MAKEKQYVFSARTTEDGLGLLNKLKADLGVGWDEMVVDAVCEKHNLNKAALMLPKPERPKKEPEPKAEKKSKAARKPQAVSGQTTDATEAEVPMAELPGQAEAGG